MAFDIKREQKPTPGTIILKGHTGYGLPIHIECHTEDGTPKGAALVVLEQVGEFTVSRSNLLGVARALVEAHNEMFPEGDYGTSMVVVDAVDTEQAPRPTFTAEELHRIWYGAAGNSVSSFDAVIDYIHTKEA